MLAEGPPPALSTPGRQQQEAMLSHVQEFGSSCAQDEPRALGGAPSTTKRARAKPLGHQLLISWSRLLISAQPPKARAACHQPPTPFLLSPEPRQTNVSRFLGLISFPPKLHEAKTRPGRLARGTCSPRESPAGNDPSHPVPVPIQGGTSRARRARTHTAAPRLMLCLQPGIDPGPGSMAGRCQTLPLAQHQAPSALCRHPPAPSPWPRARSTLCSPLGAKSRSASLLLVSFLLLLLPALSPPSLPAQGCFAPGGAPIRAPHLLGARTQGVHRRHPGPTAAPGCRVQDPDPARSISGSGHSSQPGVGCRHSPRGAEQQWGVCRP